MDTLAKEEVKAMFMNWFEKNKATAGHVMSKQDVVKNVVKNLDAKQEDFLAKAMDELKSSGLIETKEDGLTLVLTQKGADSI